MAQMAGTMTCPTCGGRYQRGTAREHGLRWHWWCKPDTCARHHRHLFRNDGSEAPR